VSPELPRNGKGVGPESGYLPILRLSVFRSWEANTLRLLFAAAFAVALPLYSATDLSGALLAPIVIREDRPPGSPAITASEFNGASVPLDARGESSLVRVLSKRVGVFVQRAGGDDAQTSIQLRGQDPSQTRFFIDGIPLTDAQYHTSQLGWFPAEAMGSVDLFPEGSPAVLGADGLGGAIALHLPDAGSGASFLGARVGAFEARRLFGRVAGKSPLPYSVFIDGSQAREDFAYLDNAGTPLISGDDTWTKRDHNGQRWLSVLPQVTLWKTADSHARLLSFHTLRENEIPGAVGLPLRGELNTQFHLVGAQMNGREAGLDWETTAYGSGLDQRFSATADLSALQIRSSLSTALGGRVKVGQESYWGGWETSASIQADAANLSTNQGSVDARRLVLPLGASARWAFARDWMVKPAVLAQFFSYDGSSPRRSAAVSPRIGLEWSFAPRQRLRVSGGHFHRAPALAELYGAPSTIAANPALQDERAWKAELGWDARWAKVGLWREIQTSVSLSSAWAENLIVLVPNSQLSFSAQNVGRSRIVSTEFGLEAGLARDWTFRANAAFLSAINLSSAAAYQGRTLPMRPSFRGGLETQWAQGPWRLTYSIQATGALYADSANTRRIGEYWEHGVWGSWESRALGTWMVELRNLTDATTVSGQDWNFSLAQNTTGLAGFPAPGRRIYLTWRYGI
jgi:iron complex outermembrane receptor protein